MGIIVIIIIMMMCCVCVGVFLVHAQLKHHYAESTAEVYVTDLEKKAVQHGIYDLRPFFCSRIFRDRGMHVDERRAVIVKSFA